MNLSDAAEIKELSKPESTDHADTTVSRCFQGMAHIYFFKKRVNINMWSARLMQI